MPLRENNIEPTVRRWFFFSLPMLCFGAYNMQKFPVFIIMIIIIIIIYKKHNLWINELTVKIPCKW